MDVSECCCWQYWTHQWTQFILLYNEKKTWRALAELQHMRNLLTCRKSRAWLFAFFEFGPGTSNFNSLDQNMILFSFHVYGNWKSEHYRPFTARTHTRPDTSHYFLTTVRLVRWGTIQIARIQRKCSFSTSIVTKIFMIYKSHNWGHGGLAMPQPPKISTHPEIRLKIKQFLSYLNTCCLFSYQHKICSGHRMFIKRSTIQIAF
jgi:hypothetical protein